MIPPSPWPELSLGEPYSEFCWAGLRCPQVYVQNIHVKAQKIICGVLKSIKWPSLSIKNAESTPISFKIDSFIKGTHKNHRLKVLTVAIIKSDDQTEVVYSFIAEREQMIFQNMQGEKPVAAVTLRVMERVLGVTQDVLH